jgi:hypothetical protein
MKILITGGDGKLAKKFKKVYGENCLNPSKSELNLLDKSSIINYYNNNKNIDGILLNATLYPSNFYEFDEFFNEHVINDFINSFKLVAIGNQQLINLYKDKVKFIINISSGATYKKRPYGDHFGYKLVKTISNFVIEEYSVNKNNLYDNIKLITFNPSHMETGEQYESQATLLLDIIKNINECKTGYEYYPHDDGMSDINDTHFIKLK